MTTLLTSRFAFFFVGTAEGLPATFTVTTSDPTVAYVATELNSGVTNKVSIVPKKAGAVSITLAGQSQNGTALPNQVFQFQFNDPSAPQASTFTTNPVDGSFFDASINQAPSDPGTPSVSGTC